jgi:hypothetical integral membrane protein (TIGR02206 family)
MNAEWRLFGAWHLGILGAIAAASWLLTIGMRKWPRAVGSSIALLLAAGESYWYYYRLSVEGFRFPEGLPLQLCDLTVWLTAFTLLARRQAVFEFTFFAGVSGAAMALIWPDLWAPLCSYPTIYFFSAHGLIVASMAALAWSGTLRPKPGCVWRAMIVLNVYAALVGLFNVWYHTNYMYLCEKPEGTSLLDWMGPWPWYIVSGEVVALALFALLWLPFRAAARRGREAAPKAA